MKSGTKLNKSGDRRGTPSHQLGGTPTYRTWYTMISRCTNPKDIGWDLYGGRGIKVHPDWMSIENFVRDMGIRPEGMTLDRIDPNGIYEPGNCRWLSMTEQNRNRRSNVVNKKNLKEIRSMFEKGVPQKEIAMLCGVSQSTVSRAARGVTWGDHV